MQLNSANRSQQKIQVQVNSRGPDLNVDALRGSVHVKNESDGFAETLRLGQDGQVNPRGSQIEDSMMSANSSVNDTIMNSVPTLDQSTLPQPPRTQGRGPNARRG